MRSHSWPGNVRELEHWIESAIALAPDGRITASHLPARRRDAPSAAPSVAPSIASSAPPSVAPSSSSGVTLAPDSALSFTGMNDWFEEKSPGSAEKSDAHLMAPSSGEPGNVSIPLGLTLDEAARRYVEATVTACDGNKTEAARRLDIGRNTITRSLQKRGR
jgi:DNA-binding NtrC family response regulator